MSKKTLFAALISGVATKKILVVDDNQTNLGILKGYLEVWNFSCDLAISADIALSLMRAVAKVGSPFDLVLTDMQMPGTDGVELGKAIKADPTLRDSYIIMLTSRGLRGDAARMKDIGFSAYLTKPLRRSQLFDCLSTVLSNAPEGSVSTDIQLVTRHTIADETRRKLRSWWQKTIEQI